MVTTSDDLPVSTTRSIKNSLEIALNLQRKAKHTLNSASKASESAQQAAVTAMNMIELKNYVYAAADLDTNQPVMVTATLVEPSRTEIDEELLRELVSAEVWDRITTTKVTVDRKKIDSAVAEGLLDLEVLERVVSYRDTSPYIRQKQVLTTEEFLTESFGEADDE